MFNIATVLLGAVGSQAGPQQILQAIWKWEELWMCSAIVLSCFANLYK